MTLTELQQKIQGYLNNPEQAGIVLYSVLSSEPSDVLRLTDISSEAASELKSMMLQYLQEKFINNSELSFTGLTDADNRKNTAYYYDLNEKPKGLELLDEVLADGNKPQFSFSLDDFTKLKGFVITIGTEENKIALYKRHHHLSTMKADRTFGIYKSDHRFVKMKEDIIKLSKTVDFLQVDEHLVIANLKALETDFGFEAVVKGHAMRNVQAIDALGLVEDITILTSMVADLRQAKKLMRIKANSPVMQIPATAVIRFVKSHRPIMKKFKISECGLKLKLDTKVSQKLFLALMNDDFLTSELTKLYYAGLAKDKMDIDDELTNTDNLSQN